MSSTHGKPKLLFYDYSWHIFFLQPIAEGNCDLKFTFPGSGSSRWYVIFINTTWSYKINDKIQPNNLWHQPYSLPRFEEEVSSYSSTSSTLQENETKEVPKKTYFRSALNSETVCYLCLLLILFEFSWNFSCFSCMHNSYLSKINNSSSMRSK